jgi:16S rRNA A1518/A1519 N6-dimethyltransferase RsmA/KsgA/DIM1 with predicted DNA glycosylase/AP lyase activity
MPGHWLFTRLGNRVLRPGGLELTQRLLDELCATPDDDVVEFGPGLGVTAQLTLSRRRRSCTAIERDAAAVAAVEDVLKGPDQHCGRGTAEEPGLPAESATVVYGEAMLSMQPATIKARIVSEASRLLQPGDRYGIHTPRPAGE